MSLVKTNQQLTVDLIDMFAKDVEETGAQFKIVYLPRIDDIKLFQNAEIERAPLVYQHLNDVFDMINPIELMPVDKSLYRLHYDPPIGMIIGAKVTEHISGCLQNTCQPDRF